MRVHEETDAQEKEGRPTVPDVVHLSSSWTCECRRGPCNCVFYNQNDFLVIILFQKLRATRFTPETAVGRDDTLHHVTELKVFLVQTLEGRRFPQFYLHLTHKEMIYITAKCIL